MYHQGELQVQRRAGVSELAGRVGRIIGSTIPAAAAQFLAAREFLVAATIDASGDVWASLLTGPRGFAQAIAENVIRIDAAGEQVRRDLASHGDLGLLAIDFANRRRMRANGTATAVVDADGDAIVLTTREVYSNCPQYIRDASPLRVRPGVAAEGSALTLEQRALIETAERFFIASAHPESGADASHRGGDPGFVRATATSVSWPDYPGNNMFNTLGNLAVNPRCGLLFVDFDEGRTLQITGEARIVWDGTERAVTVGVKSVRDSARAS